MKKVKAENTKERLLREYAQKHDCDAVMLKDGTVKEYRGERYTAIALYKVRTKKFYSFETTEKVEKKEPMTVVAWVGSLKDFSCTFHVRGSRYVDSKTNKVYYCIARRTDSLGRRFDEVAVGFHWENFDYYNPIYEEIENTRIIKGGKNEEDKD